MLLKELYGAAASFIDEASVELRRYLSTNSLKEAMSASCSASFCCGSTRLLQAPHAHAHADSDGES